MGQIKDGLRHGIGKLLFADGSFYHGFWKDDVPFGFCRLFKTNGDVYEGGCSKFRAHGKGTIYSADGYVYNGEWENDMKHGIKKNKFKGERGGERVCY